VTRFARFSPVSPTKCLNVISRTLLRWNARARERCRPSRALVRTASGYLCPGLSCTTRVDLSPCHLSHGHRQLSGSGSVTMATDTVRLLRCTCTWQFPSADPKSTRHLGHDGVPSCLSLLTFRRPMQPPSSGSTISLWARLWVCICTELRAHGKLSLAAWLRLRV
jgi:hypothetical protein